MLIAICSDSHDNLPNIKKFIDFCNTKEIQTILHCGDVTEKDTQTYFKNNFLGKIYFVEGNADISEQDKQKRTNRFQKIKRQPVPFLDLKFENIEIAVCHKKDKAVRLAETDKYHYVFYGHTHKPWQDNLNGTLIVNPGNLAGMFYLASFAVLDTINNEIKLFILNKI